MKRTKNTALAFLLALCVTLGLLPALTPTASAATNVSYLDASGKTQTAANATEVTTNDTTWGSDGAETWYVVNSTLTNADNRIAVKGDVRLILADGFTLTASRGINVTGSDSLTIYGQSAGTGALTATGYYFGEAGIGGGSGGAGGAITINGGKVTATGGDWGAGIGGGAGGAGGAITINGGEVTATGSENSAGIGGGGGDDWEDEFGGASGAIRITGGTVNAKGNVGGGDDSGGAGIGAGYYGQNSGDGNSISITGGTVTATVPNETLGAAIGNGGGGTDVNVTIGARLTVKAGTDASGAGAQVVTDVANNKNYKYAVIQHGHTFDSTYQLTETNAANDTITATCSADDCDLTDGKASLTISAPETQAGGAAVLHGDAKAFGVSDADIRYFQKSGSSWNAMQGLPNGTGFFKASLTVASYTIEVSYGVNAITVAEGIPNGTITAPAVATVGAVVPLTVTPDTGYELATLTPSKNGGGDSIEVTEDNNGNKSFIMPDEEVTVSGTFDLRNIPVKLTVQNGDEASGAAALFTDSYEAAGENFTSKMNETFILSVACDENYTFAISGSTPVDFRDLSYDEKEGYIAQNPTADANTHLLKVTTPAIDSGDLTLTVNFRKIKLYTIFYQPADQTVTAMWCKSGNDTGNFQIEMDSADSIGDKKVFSVHLSMPDDPAKIAFAATSEAVAEATMTNVKVKKSVGEASTWSNGFDGQFLVIGGNAKAVTAAFVNDVSALAVYDDETKTITGDGTGASYQITVCGADDSGNVTTPGAVTAPAAPTREGFTFVGWRGFEGTAPEIKEKIYQPGNTILISDNTIIGCEWTPIQPNVKLNLNDGTGGTAVNKVNYKDILNISQNPERNGLAFDGWTAGKSVTENGRFFAKGSFFDFATPITNDLELTAQWKHVHSYTCVQIDDSGFNNALEKYYGYLPHIHVRFCGCADVKLMSHTFRNGVCTDCGYTKPGATEAKLEVSYWKEGASNAWMRELDRTEKINNEVSVSAYDEIGNYQFSKWQYSLDNGTTWDDLAAETMVGFIIPRSMQVRAIYVNSLTEPKVNLSAREYTVSEQGYLWDSVLFQMEYKLPDGYAYVDAGVKMGDNQGISFYAIKKPTIVDVLVKMAVDATNTVTDFIFSSPLEHTKKKEEPKYIIEKREDSVLKKMSAAELSKYMYENKPVNIPEYEPIYWVARPTTTGKSGSVNTLTPLRFIQKNNGKHYIYGMAYLSYKTPGGEIKTIYTEALPTTRDNVPGYDVMADPNGMTNTKSN